MRQFALLHFSIHDYNALRHSTGAHLAPAVLGLLQTSNSSKAGNRHALFRKKAILVDTARDGLIDEPARIDAWRERRLLSVGHDSFAAEPAVHRSGACQTLS